MFMCVWHVSCKFPPQKVKLNLLNKLSQLDSYIYCMNLTHRQWLLHVQADERCSNNDIYPVLFT